MKIGRIFSGISKSAQNRRAAKTLAEIEKHVKLPNLSEIPDTATALVRDIYAVRGAIAGFAKKNNVVVSMSVKKQPKSLIPRLDITMSRLDDKIPVPGAKPEVISVTRPLDIIDNEPLTFVKPNTRMLESSDGLNYEARGYLMCEDNFLRRVFRTVDLLLGDFKK